MATKKTTTKTTTVEGGDAFAEHEEFFRTSHAGRTDVVAGTEYETDYAPAYRYGLQLVRETGGRYEDVAAAAKTGWESARGTSKLTYDQAESAVRAAHDRVIQLREERLNVSKDRVEAGAATVRKDVKTEQKSVTVPVEREELVIERKAVNRKVGPGDVDIGEETIRVPLSEEKVRVSKEAVVTEEVTVGKKKVAGEQTVAAELKREELVVDEKTRTTAETDEAKKSRKKS